MRKITLEEIKNGWVMTDSATKDKVHYHKTKTMVEDLHVLIKEKQTELAE